MAGPHGIDQLALAARGSEASLALPLIESEVAKMRQTVFAKAFAAIREGTLSPEMAQNLWLEIYAYHRLLKNFETAVSMGHSAAAASPAAVAQTKDTVNAQKENPQSYSGR